jgi:hypothetical protein
MASISMLLLLNLKTCCITIEQACYDIKPLSSEILRKTNYSRISVYLTAIVQLTCKYGIKSLLV